MLFLCCSTQQLVLSKDFGLHWEVLEKSAYVVQHEWAPPSMGKDAVLLTMHKKKVWNVDGWFGSVYPCMCVLCMCVL